MYSTDEERIAVQKLLADSIKIKEDDPSLDKVQKIALYLLKHLDTYRGIPSDSMDVESPLAQYKSAVSRRSKV
jgi:hypothetical protein